MLYASGERVNMKDSIARTLRIIVLVFGAIMLCAPILAQEPIWGRYHHDIYHSGQNPNSIDIKSPNGPDTLNLIWVFPRLDAAYNYPDESATIVDDFSGTGFSRKGNWEAGRHTDAYNGDYHYAKTVPVGGATAPTATWFWPSNLPGGKYQIFVWIPPTDKEASHEATYIVYDDSNPGGETYTLNQKTAGAWKLLTTDYFTFGSSANTRVELVARGGNAGDIVLADAVKFQPSLLETGIQIYSSPASAEIPVTLPPDGDGKGSLWNSEGLCAYIGTVEPRSGSSSSDGESQSNDYGAIYCVYGITPTLENPALPDGSPDPSVPDSEQLVAISKYLGKPKWRYPNADPTNRLPIEGPISGGIYSSPTLAQARIGEEIRTVCFVAGMDRQLYTLDAVTGELLWKGPGITIPEEDAIGFGNYTLCDMPNPDSFGGTFHYAPCDAAGANSLTWRFETADQINAVPDSAEGLAYSVYVWMPGQGGTGDYARSKTATYVVTYQDEEGNPNETATVVVDQSDPKAMGTWVKLGGSYFNPSQVVLKNTATAIPADPDGNGGVEVSNFAVVADAIMIVPDHIDGLGYSSPVTDAEALPGTTALASHVFTACTGGRLLSFDVEPRGTKHMGHLNWIYPKVRQKRAPKPTDTDQPAWGEIGASPAYSADKLYIATMDGTVRCLENVKTPTPRQKWVFPDDKNNDEKTSGFTSSPALDPPGKLYIGSTEGIFYCLNMDTGAVSKGDGKTGPVWQYPKASSSSGPDTPPTDNAPLGAFRFSTPAVANVHGVRRVWCASTDGHIYSFLAETGERLYLGENGQPVNSSGGWYSEPSLLNPVQGSVALDGESVSGNSSMYVGDMSGTLHWRDAENGSTNAWEYAGWTTPDMLFSSPNVTNTKVATTNVSWIYVGCADGHLFAFTRRGGGWGGMWQGGEWPFPGEPNDNSNKTQAAPETDIQFDIFDQDFYNKSSSFPTAKLDPVEPITGSTDNDFINNDWPLDTGPDAFIVSKDMKVIPASIGKMVDTDPNKARLIKEELTKQAKKRRKREYLPEGRVPSSTTDQIYFEWGEKINMMLWNLPEAKFIYGSGSNAFTFTMTNASSGASAGSMFKATVGDIRSYTVVYDASTTGTPVYSEVRDADGNVRRSYVMATISLDGSGGGVLPSPGPGWVLSVQIKVKANDSSTAPVTTITIPLAKLKQNGTQYDPEFVETRETPIAGVDTRQFKEANLGINNALAISDEQGLALGWGHAVAGQAGIHPYRYLPDVHTNGNTKWVNGNIIPINPPPLLDMFFVSNGTSSREARLGIMDRSAMGLTTGRQIDRFRINSSDLRFRGWPDAVESSPVEIVNNQAVLSSTVTYGMKFPWDGGLGSVDYPDIYRRYQAYEQVSSSDDPTNKSCTMMPIQRDPGYPRDYEKAFLNPDTVLVSVDVPRFQPANTWKDPNRNDGLDGYSKTMTAYIDSNRNDRFDSGNYVRGRPTTHQDTYRRFRVGLMVPPDPKLEVEEQLVDIGSAPHGLGEPAEALGFSPFNADPRIRQWFKSLTIKNAGNVNLYNLRINPAVGLVSDQAHPGAILPGNAITSSLDPLPLPFFGAFGSEPFATSGANARGQSVYLGYTLSKPRVGDPDPTVLTVPDRRRWDVDYDTRMAAADMITTAGWAKDPDQAEPLPVQVGLRVPLTQPIGTYQSFDPNFNTPYIAVFSDQTNAGMLSPTNIEGNPVAWPSFQMKATVRENQLTGGVTPTTLPQIDVLPDGTARPEDLPRVGDATPAAFRDADNLGVHLIWSSNRLNDPSLYPAKNNETGLAGFASAPWFLRHAILGYSSGNWLTANNGLNWWITRDGFLPASQWLTHTPGPQEPQLLSWTFGDTPTGLYSVRHHGPRIGENTAIPRTAGLNRTWLAWAGSADFKDPGTNKLSQQNAIFYTDFTKGGSAQGQKIWSIEHDFSMAKRNPCPVPYGSNMWMFWQGGSAGNWSIYYSFARDESGVFDTTRTNWSPDMKLRTPDCLSTVASPNAMLRHWWADLRGASAKDSDGPDAYQGTLAAQARKAFDVVYAGTSKVTGNSDIILSRYIAEPPGGDRRVLPNRVAQPMPRVFNEELMRDPKFGFYTSKHLAWWRAARGGAFGIDQWGKYVGVDNLSPDAPYIRVFFADGYEDGDITLAPGTAISATDGSVWVNGVVSEPGESITPEIDDATGIYVYKYPENSKAERVFGQMLIDFSAGVVRLTKPLKEVQITTGTRKGSYSTPEVRADYTPQAWRITTDAAADGSPHSFIEHTSMIPSVVPGLDPGWGRDKPAPVDRMWVLWRKTGTAVDSSTIFYTTMRVGVDLTALGMPPVPMNPNGTIASSANLRIDNALGPWEVDRTGTKIYFSEVDERYRSLVTPDNSSVLGDVPNPISISYKDEGGATQSVPALDVSWITELPEQSLFGFAADANVNEGSIYAFADPLPQESGTSVRLLSSKIWVFWTSTRGGVSDLYWETISPNFWAR